MASLRKIERELLACRAELRWLGVEGQSGDNNARVVGMLGRLKTKLDQNNTYNTILDGGIKAGIEKYIAALSGIDYNTGTLTPEHHTIVIDTVHSMLEFMSDIHELASTFMKGNEEKYTAGVSNALSRYYKTNSKSVSAFLQLFTDIGTSLSDPAQYANVPANAAEIKTIMPEIGRIIASV